LDDALVVGKAIGAVGRRKKDLIHSLSFPQGPFGKVYKGQWNGLPVMMRKVKLNTVNELRTLEREISSVM
jgi:hypothetical protein